MTLQYFNVTIECQDMSLCSLDMAFYCQDIILSCQGITFQLHYIERRTLPYGNKEST